MDWPLKGGGFAERDADASKVDYTRPISNGPNAVGFDHYFGISASLDMTPYVFIENDRVTEVPRKEKEFWPKRKGPAGDTFQPVDVLPKLTERAVAYLKGRSRMTEPFFLYLPLTSPHTPIVPAGRWQGRSGINAYADFVMQTDAAVGQALEALDQAGLAEETLVILTSDNGCSPEAKFPELGAHGHHPSGPFRGHKADIFEGGHRVPLIVRWPGKVKAGTVSGQLTCLNDLMATCADLLGEELPADAAEDSVSLLPALFGKAGGPSREAVVHHSINGSFAIRRGNWKLIQCGDSGGWSPPRPGSPKAKNLPPVQLYDLSSDAGENLNLHDKHPDVVADLTALLEKYVANGRSTPGAPQKNTGEVRLAF